jgi:hypothetical protein
MANYVKSTNFTVKDSLTTGDSAKRIRGSEIDAEFNNIATAVNSKANTASPNLTGSPTATTATVGDSSSRIATTAFVAAAIADEGLGTIATQDADDVAITGGNIDGTVIGDTTQAEIAGTTIVATTGFVGNLTGNVTGNVTGNATTATGLTTSTGSAPFYGARAWVCWDGTRDSTGATNTNTTARFIRGSGNVASVVYNGGGQYTITLTTALPDVNYAISGTASGSGTNGATMVTETSSSRTTTVFQVTTTQRDSGDNAANVVRAFNSVVVFR